jgi:chromosome segregation protein
MLKALELIGFKSFADKTRFEFPPGITVIVGPNGSGKSNVVDAMKWVLGEQSAKSLRGKDMADVIFKGSGEGRRMVNSAEATIIFDNSQRQLPLDSPEVHVTRRVYRSGEGEYLINREPCRLKDIRNLFRGTGVGVDAYSLIEQGKVDRMLQASPRDRRSIFEEAAGISRFKAKKLEAQRRLERVEQNLLRLSDIVEEVENRLRSVRSQASKAKRYREYRDRLQELRTHVGLSDWRQLSTQLAAAEQTAAQWRDQTAERAAQAESLDARLLEFEVELATAVETIRSSENKASHTREQIASREMAIEQSRQRVVELEENATRHRRQLAAMSGRAGDLHQRLRQVQQSLEQAEVAHRQVGAHAAERAQTLLQASRELEDLRGRSEAHRQAHLDHLRAAAAAASRISSLETQLEGWQAAVDRARQALSESEIALANCHDELTRVQQLESQSRADLEAIATRLNDARQTAATLRQSHDEERERLTAVRQRCTGARERVAVLDELDRNYEGLGLGVREVLELAGESAEGPFTTVQGLVADLIQVSVDVAPLVDVALGEKAQHIVVGTRDLLDDILSGRYQPTGRVGFVSLDDEYPYGDDPGLYDLPGVIGRLDALIQCDDRVRPMVHRLLGDVWCVASLSAAVSLRASTLPPCRFVTLAGELVDRDGTIVVGARPSMVGLVSRRSELRARHQEVAELEQQIEQRRGELATLEQQIEQQGREVANLDIQYRETDRTLADQCARRQSLQERHQELSQKRQTLDAELHVAEKEAGRTQAEREAGRCELAHAEEQVAASERVSKELENRTNELQIHRTRHEQETTTARIELARSEQNVATLRTTSQRLQEDQQERSRAVSDSQTQLTECLAKQQEMNREILRATSELALLYLHKAACDTDVSHLVRQRTACQAQRSQLANELQAVRQRLRQAEDALHQSELQIGEIRHQRNTLTDRLREDYEIDIARLDRQLSAQEFAERTAVEQEIADLRRKLNNIGAVNLDAVAELDSLESRFGSLSQQYQDLRQAKEALERIIHKINADSRRLFQETLEAIRTNFQSLYRKAFGGGRADLVLEEGVDLLEAGVDIIATPPGKPSFNNSLLSGGEKALTAVSLLLAIFQYRPSPFCVLDEVDAPFDEANIGRFVEVLKGFLDWTKFVIVTHSKKTMTAASTLYGVTMQESGVSKRVSVRFEDVTEDGHILPEAVQRDADPPAEEERGAA